jgi:NAD(P)-dependent dehydrogenase (short-subunit alcohol dehydrogenase family)
VRADVTRADEVAALVETAVASYGGLDCAFNNAGIGGDAGLTHEYPEQEFRRVIDVNLVSVWLCMKAELGQMLRQGGGAIVNTASVLGLVGFQHGPAYVAAKHGVVGLTRAAALEYAAHKIRVNAICPGWTLTPMTAEEAASPELSAQVIARHPLGRFGTPEEMAEAATWLCSDAASFVTGVALVSDGGYTAQ